MRLLKLAPPHKYHSPSQPINCALPSTSFDVWTKFVWIGLGSRFMAFFEKWL